MPLMLGLVNLKSVYINADIGVNLLQADHTCHFPIVTCWLKGKKSILNIEFYRRVNLCTEWVRAGNA